MGNLAAFVTLLALYPIAALWNGYALTVLWRWFITPTFGATELLLWQAAGLALIVGHMTAHAKPDKDRDNFSAVGGAFVMMAIKPPLALLFGWIILGLFK